MDATSKCKFCQSPIGGSARVCPTCKLYQFPFWNVLPYLAGLVALIAIVGTAVVYLHERWTDLKSKQYGDVELVVLAIDSESGITLDNTGERDIFVSIVRFASPRMREFRSVNKVIKAGELVRVTYNDPRTPRDTRCLNGEVAQGVLRMDYQVKDQLYQFYGLDSAELATHGEDFETTHAVLDGTATLIYYPAGEVKRSEAVIPGKILISQRANASGEFSEELLPPGDTFTLDENKFTTPLEPKKLEPPSMKPPADQNSAD